jgi:HKD family nuclease
MEIIFTDNITKNLLEMLNQSIYRAKELKFAVAFVKYSGFKLLEESIKNCLKNGGNIEFLVGLDFRTTEPKVLRLLKKMSDEGLLLRCYCFCDPSYGDTPIYHPKLYLINDAETATIALGSSNLTRGGFKNNVEVNVIITAFLKEEIVSDAYGIFNRLKFQQGRFEPDQEYIDKYEEVYERVKRKSTDALRERDTKEKIGLLKEQERILPKPIPTKSELFGWLNLVYDRLPLGTFRTSDMYQYVEEFQKIYPENKNIKAKIRQQLQFLRDMRFVRNPSRDRWTKL